MTTLPGHSSDFPPPTPILSLIAALSLPLPVDVIGIPEIASVLTEYLSRGDLLSCILVNKSWLDAFVPHLWETVRIADFDFLAGLKRGDTDCQPWSVGDICLDHPLRKYGHLIKNLTLRYRRSLCQLAPSLVSLRTLVIDDYMDASIYDNTTLMKAWKKNNHPRRFDTTSVLIQIFRRNPALSTVKLALAPLDDVAALAGALGKLPELEHLVVGDDFSQALSRDLESVFQSCAHSGCLRRLRIGCSAGLQENEFLKLKPVIAFGHPEIPETMLTKVLLKQQQEQQFGIEQIYLDGLPERDLKIGKAIERCGRTLQNLVASGFRNKNVRDLIRVVPNSCWYLRHIAIMLSNGVDPKLWLAFLKVCYPLETLKVVRGLPVEPLVDILQKRHAATLQCVRFERLNRQDFEDPLVKLLEFCPLLEEFWSNWPVETSFFYPLVGGVQTNNCARWACASNLRRLTICLRNIPKFFDSPVIQDRIQRLVLRCLGQAKGLKVLGIQTDSMAILYPPVDASYIIWREAIVRQELEACFGMDALRVLTCYGSGFHAAFN